MSHQDKLRAALAAAGCLALLSACGNGEPSEAAGEPAEAEAAQAEAQSAADAEAAMAEAMARDPEEHAASGEAHVMVEGEMRTLTLSMCQLPDPDTGMVSIMAENEDGDALFISGTPPAYRADVTIGRRTHVMGFTDQSPFNGAEFSYTGALTTTGSNAQVEGMIHTVCPDE